MEVNKIFDTQDQDDGSVLLLRHGVPVGRMRVVKGEKLEGINLGDRWAAFIIAGEKEQHVQTLLDYNALLQELKIAIERNRPKSNTNE